MGLLIRAQYEIQWFQSGQKKCHKRRHSGPKGVDSVNSTRNDNLSHGKRHNFKKISTTSQKRNFDCELPRIIKLPTEQ